MAQEDFADIRHTDALVAASARIFVELTRDGDEEGARIAMDYMNAHVYEAGTCATHDYCDANMTMAQAIEEALVESGVDRDRASAFVGCCDDDATPDAQERRGGIWGEAWARARSSGYSYLREQVSPEDFEALAPSMMHRPTTAEHGARYPRWPDNALADSERRQEFIDAVERDEVPRDRLSEMAAAIRAGDDARLGELLEETLGARDEADPALMPG